jgi:hypothetical protein
MNDRELRDEFVRVERTESQVRILVREIHWDGPHTPISTWATANSLPATGTEAEASAAAAGVLEDAGYFRVRGESEQRKPVGWMHNGRICQGCAEANHGVVH